VQSICNHRVPDQPHTTARNKTDPELGVQSLGREFEFGWVTLPYTDVGAKQMSTLLIKEATEYTPGYPGWTDLLMPCGSSTTTGPASDPGPVVPKLSSGWRVPSWVAGSFTAPRRSWR
jgi:hypothetical protein